MHAARACHAPVKNINSVNPKSCCCFQFLSSILIYFCKFLVLSANLLQFWSTSVFPWVLSSIDSTKYTPNLLVLYDLLFQLWSTYFKSSSLQIFPQDYTIASFCSLSLSLWSPSARRSWLQKPNTPSGWLDMLFLNLPKLFNQRRLLLVSLKIKLSTTSSLD